MGVSQIALETEYYMVDIPDILQKKLERDKNDKLNHLQLLIASNNRKLEEKDYKNMVAGLMPQNVINNTNNFDRDKMERLRNMQG